MQSSTPFFHPWAGSHYSSGGIFGKKIMVLGDSHYCGTPCGRCGENPNARCYRLTSDVIEWCLDPNCEREDWMKTYLKFERSLVGHETTSEESRKIWDSIVFYNFLQVAPMITISREDYARAITLAGVNLAINRPQDVISVFEEGTERLRGPRQ